MKNYSLFLCAGVLFGCATASFQTAIANISPEVSSQVVDGATTKTEILALFGEPNGFNPTMGGGATGMMQMSKMALDDDNPYDRVMHYKNCIMKAKSHISGPFSIGSGAMEVCDTFTALLNKQDIVIAHAYLENNLLDKEKLDSLQVGIADRKNVIRKLGGPTSIISQKGKELFIYKNCTRNNSVNNIGIPIIGGMMGREAQTNRSNCQQASIVMDKSSGKILKTNFIPFRKQ